MTMLCFLPRLVLAAVFAVVASGCATNEAEMREFIGQPSSELLTRLGTPQLRAPNPAGGEIWTYLSESSPQSMAVAGPSFQNSTFGNAVGGSPAARSATSANGFTSRREFLIDGQGRVYDFHSRGH